ncbi:MAG: YdcF family protein [Lachnospiraceae bacterium]|nr:YdcF family protein [Lachnospiraceae bacterium]
MHWILTTLFIIGGLLAALYGGVAWMAHSGTSFWMVWEVGGGFLLLLAFLHHAGILARLPRVLIYGCLGVVLLGLLLLGILVGLIARQFSAEGSADLDYVVVLGAQLRADGPSIILKDRLDTAVTYLEENPSCICIVSGGQGYNEPKSEAEGMREYLVSCGIAPDRILEEGASTNTLENIRFSKTILEQHCREASYSVGILTNNFHVFRATGIARKQGLSNVCGIAAPSHPLYLPNNTLRECIGVIKDVLVGNM